MTKFYNKSSKIFFFTFFLFLLTPNKQLFAEPFVGDKLEKFLFENTITYEDGGGYQIQISFYDNKTYLFEVYINLGHLKGSHRGDWSFVNSKKAVYLPQSITDRNQYLLGAEVPEGIIEFDNKFVTFKGTDKWKRSDKFEYSSFDRLIEQQRQAEIIREKEESRIKAEQLKKEVEVKDAIAKKQAKERAAIAKKDAEEQQARFEKEKLEKATQRGFAKEIRTTSGFYVTIPSNTIAVVGQNDNKHLRNYTGPNSDGVQLALKYSPHAINTDFVVFQDIPQTISISTETKKEDLKKIASSIKDYCSSQKKYLSQITGKNIKYYDCEVTNKFSPKFQPAIFTKSDSITTADYILQYKIQLSGGITNFTVSCTNNKTCELMKGYLSEMIKSIRQVNPNLN